jgi:hypothetical protein
MSRNVFISHATEDQTTAAEVCALLEARGIACWIAPRDVAPGAQWDDAIVDAIGSAQTFLLILSAKANESPCVKVRSDVHGAPIAYPIMSKTVIVVRIERGRLDRLFAWAHDAGSTSMRPSTARAASAYRLGV